MQRGRIAAAALVVGASILVAAAGALAQDQATVMLRNGERVSGRFEDLASGTVYVRVTLADQRRIPLDQIAVIDLVGGASGLPENELREARGADHVLVRRDGSIVKGRLVNIEGGEGSSKPDEPRTWSFRTQGGQEVRLSTNEITRLYLGNFPAAATGTSGATASQTGNANAATATVPANQQWTRTPLFVREGDMVTFQASGEITLSTDSGDVAAPAGSTRQRYARGAPLPNALAGALIGRIGNGRPFGIGNQAAPIRMTGTGLLMLGINDDVLNDNTGQFTVEIQRQAATATPRRR